MKKFKMLGKAEMKEVKGGNTAADNCYNVCRNSGAPAPVCASSCYGNDGISPKIAACKPPKQQGSRCSWDYNGAAIYGCCDAYMASELFCTTLNTSCF